MAEDVSNFNLSILHLGNRHTASVKTLRTLSEKWRPVSYHHFINWNMTQSKSKKLHGLYQVEGTRGSSEHSKTKETWSALCVDSQVSNKGCISFSWLLRKRHSSFLGPYLHRTLKMLQGLFSSVRLNWILPLVLQVAWWGKEEDKVKLSVLTPFQDQAKNPDSWGEVEVSPMRGEKHQKIERKQHQDKAKRNQEASKLPKHQIILE